jgi:hypothetical protein
MNKLQASMRDRSAKTWKERITMYKVGSPMKGCHNCGDVEYDEESGRRRYLSGFQVFRSYKPWETKWTWSCQECGAKDLACWEPDQDGMVEHMLGKEPIVGARGAVASRKYSLRKSLMADKPKEKKEPRVPEQVARIEELKMELERLKMILKGGR